jgi:formylmethanofuran dehydrogenase subunit B
MTSRTQTEHVTCLGCGCGCDDLAVQVSEGRIVNVTAACPIGRTWLGDGVVPANVLRNGQPSTLSDAIADAARTLTEAAGNCLVSLGTDISSQTQRAALEIADVLRARVETPTSAAAVDGLLAAQRRGRAAATLGEIRHRADAIVFWGVDPAQRYPRFAAQCGLNVGEMQPTRIVRDRVIIGVGIGSDLTISGADQMLTLRPEEEITALSFMRASVLGRSVTATSPAVGQAVEVAGRLSRARYAVLVHDADPHTERGNPLRAEALIALVQALNTPTRAALSTLRGGGNRVGAEAVLTSQTGYPFAVDYSRGYPRYLPTDKPQLSAGEYRAVLIVGSPPEFPVKAGKNSVTMIVGPRASQSRLRARIAIDTGVAGIHEAGTAYRMDEVPLELTPPLPPIRSARDVVTALADAVRALRQEQR